MTDKILFVLIWKCYTSYSTLRMGSITDKERVQKTHTSNPFQNLVSINDSSHYTICYPLSNKCLVLEADL